MTYSREPRRRGDLMADVTTREQDTFPKLARANAPQMPDRVAIREDQEQVDNLLALRARCPRLETIMYDDPRGLRAYRDSCLLSLAELEEAGRKFEIGHPTYFDDEVARGHGEDVAIICYTSGTTGVPKGAMLSHRNLIVTALNAARAENLQADEEILSYLPMAWVGD